ATDSKKEIIPCLIMGTKQAMPVNKFFYLFPTALKMHFLPAVSAENITAKDLKEKVFNIMKEYYTANA
ncbi:MAG: hypothetical protein RIR31_38, partial [Bacteroidota bacterium]